MENFTEKTLYCSPQLRELDVDNIVNGEGRESNPMTGLTSEFENKAYSVNEDILKGDGESGIGGE